MSQIMMPDEQERLNFPAPVADVPTPKPPVASLLAPVALGVLMWLMTRSPYSFALAAAGPFLAGFTWWESHRRAARRRALALSERERAIDELLAKVEACHERERQELSATLPGATESLNAPLRASLWAGRGESVRLRLGTTVGASRLSISGEALTEREHELRARSRTLSGAPLPADPTQGIALCGPELLRRSYERGLRVQLRARHPPEDIAELRIVGCERSSEAPPGFLVVELRSTSVAILHGPGSAVGDGQEFVPEMVSRRAEKAFEAVLEKRTALLRSQHEVNLPGLCSLGQLVQPEPGVLNCSFSVDAHGEVPIDLVVDGPHALVGGMTGSGKSELLGSWAVALASCRPPDELGLLLVDFKGGTAFDRLAVLPHVVGVVTDLSGTEASRAVASLSAELRRREALLARLGARELPEAATLRGSITPGEAARLVVLVDEYAALVAADPELGVVLGDVAARGRALGIHLVLGTQRPSGVVRDALASNCPLRIALRMRDSTDSRWLIGSDACAMLPDGEPGLAVVSGGAGQQQVRVARTSDDEIRAVAEKWAGHPARAFRPWLAPLAASIKVEEAGDAIALCDAPEEQRHLPLVASPELFPLLVLGAPGSGKSSVLRALSASRTIGDCEVICVGAGDIEGAWDGVQAALARLDEQGSRSSAQLLLVDDTDAIAARLGDEHGEAWLALLARLAREGRAGGVLLAVSAGRLTASLRTVASHARETIVLAQINRQEHILAGAPPELYEDRLNPGGGFWHGRRIQFVDHSLENTAPLPAFPAVLEAFPSPPPGVVLPLVTNANALARGRLGEMGFSPESIVEATDVAGELPAGVRVVIGEASGWSGCAPLFDRLRRASPVVFYRCVPSDLRLVTRSRGLNPPPLASHPDRCWLLCPDGTVRRSRLAASDSNSFSTNPDGSLCRSALVGK